MQFRRSLLKAVLGAVHDNMLTYLAGRLLQQKLGSNMLGIPKSQKYRVFEDNYMWTRKKSFYESRPRHFPQV